MRFDPVLFAEKVRFDRLPVRERQGEIEGEVSWWESTRFDFVFFKEG